ncbi:hypothetical protein BP00DRAFT_5571 [Aspergillus indologenus CBS 114.80]|uniref:Uncharacterized protein n=1 Tax=Aspergillus indologenus CBS 114.80 TaxID=1450541 RepID=A0A2V5IJN2_9EURO|nr:hypothetical protein BP00DRAFT_5571 [Aspergillus indologenus CBS 114.80]
MYPMRDTLSRMPVALRAVALAYRWQRGLCPFAPLGMPLFAATPPCPLSKQVLSVPAGRFGITEYVVKISPGMSISAIYRILCHH